MIRPTLDGWSVRLRMGQANGKAVRPWLPMPAMSEPQAAARHDRLQRLATEFVRAGKANEAEHTLRLCAKQPTPKAFEAAERAARRLLTTDPEATPTGPRTFRDVAELWLTGELHKLYPDDVPKKTEDGRKADRAILATFFPLLGQKPMSAITLDDTDAAKRLIPASVKQDSTRAIHLTRLRTVFKLAQAPLELITALPLRGKFVPKKTDGRDFWYLYPTEATLLLSCVAIPLEFRMLYGFLLHNGTRIGETLRLTWVHIDWETAIVRLEKSWTKTKRGRTWKLDPDVLRALRRYWESKGKPTSGLVFRRADGKPITRKRVTARFVPDVRKAGIARPELLASTKDSRQLRVHDLRATFVTIARKVGRPDRWIMDRTGHETLGVLGKYERLVRQAADLDLGWFAPLDQTLYPEPKMDQSMDQSFKNPGEKAVLATRTWSADGFLATTEQPNLAAAVRSNDTGPHLGPSPEGGVDQKTNASTPALTLAEPTLRRLLELATKAREWAIVKDLSAQLEAVEAARPGNVTRLDDRRKR